MTRPDWDSYFMNMAQVAATRATCDRKHVGAVIVRDRTVLATGYNGSVRGLSHCDEAGHLLKEMGGRQSCVRTVHSEMNAIAQAAKNGVSINGATLYCTASPCWDCAKLALNSGIVRVVMLEPYESRYGLSADVADLFGAAGVEYLHLPEAPCP